MPVGGIEYKLPSHYERAIKLEMARLLKRGIPKKAALQIALKRTKGY